MKTDIDALTANCANAYSALRMAPPDESALKALAFGWALVALKKALPHGEYQLAFKSIGCTRSMADRCKSCANRLSAAMENSALLKAIGSSSKLFELLALDDSEIDTLFQSGAVRGIDLAKLQTMTVLDIRQTLRPTVEAKPQHHAAVNPLKKQCLDLVAQAGSVTPLDDAQRLYAWLTSD